MKKLLHRVLGVLTIVASIVSLSLHANVVGTYVLEDSEESRFKWKRPELAIKVDDEGKYSATLNKGTGEVLLDTRDIEVDQKKFKVVFTMSSGLGELEITFAGQVIDGKMSGTISESMFSSEVKLVGKLKSENETQHQREGELEFENTSTLSVSTESQTINPEIVGTYVLESKSNSRRKPELKIALDREGKYSATLIAGKITETDEIEGEDNEFSATFTISTSMGDMEITYAGHVEQSKLSGSISESMFGTEVELVGKLKNEDTID